MNWQKELEFYRNVENLKSGNPKQKLVYEILTNQLLPCIPDQYMPTLAGTIPIRIDTENSDIDLICFSDDHDIFREVLIKNFKSYPGFKIHQKQIRKIPSLICRFTIHLFKVEVFGQPVGILQQNAFRHMVIEGKILENAPAGFRDEIVTLKLSGLSTEEAFAKILNLKGDPYIELLKFDHIDKIKRIDWHDLYPEK